MATGVSTWLVLGALLSLTMCTSFGHPSRSTASAAVVSPGIMPFNIRAWLQMLRGRISQIQNAVEGSKRSCNGFPCMYTHLGAKAGRQAMMRSLMSIMHDCAHNPSCSPGKRRRRSTSHLLSLLTRRMNNIS